MKLLHIEYYAALREARGVSKESLQLDDNTPAELYERLRDTHGLRLHRGQLRVVINEAFASWDTLLQDGDTIVFIPPVAGG
jgi:molybdopterin converting factor subunit 1